ncbi:MMPL family transporter [Marmoricola sp. RAF53]|uniref:MMPL family transporter n=1 Tax=Marmoricola sp. RAF53 TaxID=3233059 RepID=UPI003F976C08
MNRLHRLGLATARHPWRVLGVWLLVLVAAGAAAGTWGGTLKDNWNVPGARAQAGLEQLREHVPASGGSSAQVVLHDGGGVAEPVLAATVARLGALPHVVSATPRVSADGDTALVTVRYDVPTTDGRIMGDLAPLEEATTPATEAGYTVELGGELPGTAEEIQGVGEIVGVAVALVLLLLAFGSVVAAGLPILTAAAGLVVGGSLVTLLAATMHVSPTAPTIAVMVGLGVGIDYALLVVTRHVERLRAGDDPVEAAAAATARAGRSVLGAGLTVLVSLLGLPLAGLPTFSAFGLATAFAVGAVMVAALTLVPALCALAGPRLLPRKVRRGVVPLAVPADHRPGLTARWAARVARRPLAWAGVALVVMLTLAAPALGMHTWPQDGGSESTSSTTRRAHDLIADAFGPGANGPLTMVVDRDRVDAAGLAEVRRTVAGDPGVAVSGPVLTSPDGRLAVWDVEPTTAPSDRATTALMDRLRADLPAGVEITGYVPVLADISAMLAERIWWVVGFVVVVSVVLLTVMFRSVLVPIKAALMNLLSIAAAYGVMTLVFQHGWGLSLLGMDHTVAVSSWVPILMFAVLFGLSMDYEVFLVSAIRDDWLDTGDAKGSVVRGLAATGRVISVAAAIMVAVFLGFASESGVVVKMLGLGMAVAVALDATVVRMVLVPATMTLLGRWNWWFPRFGRTSATPPAPRPQAPADAPTLTGA